MNDERDYFNLEQVAEVCGQSVADIKNAVFSEDNHLVASYYIKRPVSADLYTDKEITLREGDYPITERERLESKVSFTGIVSVYPCSRNSGTFDGKLELNREYGRRPTGIEGFLTLPRLYHKNQSGLEVDVVLLESCEISEDKLIVHRDQLKQYIRIFNDHEAMERYEQLCGEVRRVKKPMAAGMKQEGELNEINTLIAEGLKLFPEGSGREFSKFIYKCFSEKAKYPFMAGVLAMTPTADKAEDNKEFIRITVKHGSGRWYSQKTFETNWSTVKKRQAKKNP